MFKPLTRLLSLIVCFQLAWGCNSSQVAVTGAGASTDSFFGIEGTIVKGLERATNLLFPSAMAAGVKGTVVVYDFKDPQNIVEIASQVLDGSTNTYSIKLQKIDIEDRVIRVVFHNPGVTEMREKIADSSGHEDSMIVDLDAKSTLVSALVKQEIKVSGETDPAIIREVINKFDPSKFQEMIKKAKGRYEDFNNPIISVKATELLYQLKDGDINSVEFAESYSILKDEAKTALVLGGRLDCSTAEVSVKESAKFRANLSFVTTDEATKKALNIDTISLGKISTVEQGNLLLQAFYGKLEDLAATDVEIIGLFKLEDTDNKINSSCKITVSPPPPQAFTDKLDGFLVDDYGKLEEAMKDLDMMYADAVVRLGKDYEAAGIDIKSGEGKVQYQEQLDFLDELYNDLATEAMNYFIFGVKKEAPPMEKK